MKNVSLSPVRSLLKTIGNVFCGKIYFPKRFNTQVIQMPDNATFEVFRHVVVGDLPSLQHETGTVFVVRFKLSKMSVARNIRFSRLPIPFFIGLPGFRAKFWFLDRETGYNQGVYQWRTEQDAINYSQSFAVKFMTRRAVKGSVSFQIIPDENIYHYLKIRTNDV